MYFVNTILPEETFPVLFKTLHIIFSNLKSVEVFYLDLQVYQHWIEVEPPFILALGSNLEQSYFV